MKKNQTRDSTLTGFYGWVEKIGNKVPHPVYLFIWFFVLTLILSALLSATGLTAVNPATKKPVAVVNLLTSQSIANIAVNAMKEFVNFPPLGTVLICTLGLGVATGSGLLKASLKLAGLSKSAFMITAIVMLIGINGNIAGDAAFVVYPPLVAMLFQGMGQNPLAGLFAGFASVACGFGANFLVGSGDMSLAGMTEAAAKLIDPKYVASPAMGYYFLFVSALVLTPIGTWVTLRFVEPKLNEMGLGTSAANAELRADNVVGDTKLTPVESKGLKLAGAVLLAYFVVIALLTLPGMPFCAPKGGSVITGPLMKSLPPLIALMFLIPGYAYGKVVGTMKTFNDAIKGMTNEIKTLANFIVICFFAAQFLAVFRDSNIGLIIAIYGGNLLKASGLPGPWLLASFVVVVGIINLFIGSANAKWSVLSSVFVPMLMIAGISPAGTQVAYRMGDSITNNITPTLPYLAIMLGYAQQYDSRAKTGTVLAYMLPYTFAFTIAWIALLLVWLYLKLPVGPGYYGFM
ncbi:MAG TPA: AbgT family transporter [Firmicutes bacterium]|nr:AbgT family transporter [Bacillota bacterium]